MEWGTRQQRKRKSRNSDIFEVSERDLSPESSEVEPEEPETKISKCEETQASGCTTNNDEHNLNSSDCNISSDNIILLDDSIIDAEPKQNDSLDDVDSSTLTYDKTTNLVEEGEVSEAPLSPQVAPYISIQFANETVAEQYKQKFCKFIQSFVELKIVSQSDTKITISKDINLSESQWVVLDSTISTQETCESEELKAVQLPKKKKKKKKPKELFVLDSNPNEHTHQIINLKYTARFEVSDESIVKPVENNARPVNNSHCFNCKKAHAIKDCQEPRNFQRINANRKAFLSQKSKQMRYYVEDEQKYSHLKPGQISDNLKEAMGLQKNQIPSYVYNMRKLGYPPGWLEEAKIMDSELNMFDIDGNEYTDDTSKKRTKGLDPEKIIEYPGFNVPLHKNTHDEHTFYRVPPFSKNYSKENMIDFYKALVRKEEDDLDTQDMDLDESASSDKVEFKQLIEDPSTSDIPSLSLIDLEREKNCLLKELENQGSDDNTVSSAGDEKKCEVSESKEGKEADDEAQSKNDETNENEEILSPVNVNIKNSIYGTPILKSSSPYNHLPNPNNFSEGVSDVINFENLPNSTGKYVQMSGVLQRVRDTLKNLPNKT